MLFMDLRVTDSLVVYSLSAGTTVEKMCSKTRAVEEEEDTGVVSISISNTEACLGISKERMFALDNITVFQLYKILCCFREYIPIKINTNFEREFYSVLKKML